MNKNTGQNIRLKELKEVVQKYADEHCEGNLSLAVRTLIKKGLSNES